MDNMYYLLSFLSCMQCRFVQLRNVQLREVPLPFRALRDARA